MLDTAALARAGTQAGAEPGPIHACFHCGERLAADRSWQASVASGMRNFCCAGCLGVACTLEAAGMSTYYAQRIGPAAPVAAVDDDEFERLALAAHAEGHVREPAAGSREISLLLEGLHCAACITLIESWLGRQPGVLEATVHYASRRASVRWAPDRIDLAGILRVLSRVGYRAYPYDPQRREALARRESRELLLRTAIALLAMMQVMMLAIPVYIGGGDVEPEYRTLFDWASLLLSLPVVTYCAWPILAAAAQDIARRRLGMNVPVALGIACAFVASAWSTLRGEGQVYFDSLTMFVALLLLARWVELRGRQRAGDAIEMLSRELPATAERLPGHPATSEAVTVSALSLAPGDVIRVAAGAAVPADGVVIEGRSSVDEALLTGESWPQSKCAGDTVLAGSVNRAHPLLIRVTASGDATALRALTRLVERAAAARPRVAQLADRVAGVFVTGLIIVAALSAAAWWWLDPSRALAIAVSVLVVSCPCALSLATPTAIACATGALAQRGILLLRADAIERLARVNRVVLDKTGTLTQGKIRLVEATPVAERTLGECLAIAAALERGSLHPIAPALRAYDDSAVRALDVREYPGCGIEGTVGGKRYRIGASQWVAQTMTGDAAHSIRVADEFTAVVLGDEQRVLAVLAFGDVLRPGAPALVRALAAMRIVPTLLSGDRTVVVRQVALTLGISDPRGAAMPEDKRATIAALQREGAIVAMVGDGINDAPALAQADVSLAFGNAAALAQRSAALVVTGDDPRRIAEAFAIARRGMRIVRQNLGWALVYNAIAIPLAASGHLTPLAAAIGMSVSSLVVVGNALRLLRGAPRRAQATASPVDGWQRADNPA
jgi:Cu2+-exporting ATPase